MVGIVHLSPSRTPDRQTTDTQETHSPCMEGKWQMKCFDERSLWSLLPCHPPARMAVLVVALPPPRQKVPILSERTHICTDGLKLATRHWTNFDATDDDDDYHNRRGPNDDDSSSSPPSSRRNRKEHTRRAARRVLCLHGWLDNAASFERLAPTIILDSMSSSLSVEAEDAASKDEGVMIPTEIVALDFPGEFFH